MSQKFPDNDPRFDSLRRLLAAKRNEPPPKETMDGFLQEFHRRLDCGRAAEIARKANRPWLRMLEWIGLPPRVPGDEAFPALRRLLALKRFEHPSEAYLNNFIHAFHRRLRNDEMAEFDLLGRIRVALGTHPLRLAQGALAVSLTLMLGLSAFQHWKTLAGPTMASVRNPAPLVTVAAYNENAMPVEYVLDRTDRSGDDSGDPAVLRVPVHRVRSEHYVMDAVDIPQHVYETAYNF